MEKEFVPYEQALKLKELGFDEPCLGSYYSYLEENFKEGKFYYRGELNIEYSIYSENTYYILAPTWQSAFRWFREKYNLESSVDIDNSYRIFGGIWDVNGYKDCVYDIDSGAYNSHEESELDCLKKLIEIVENI